MTAFPFDDLTGRRRTAAARGPAGPSVWARLRAGHHVRQDRAIDAHLDGRAVVDLRMRWREAATRAGLGRTVVTTLGGVGVGGLPVVERVDPGTYLRPPYLMVRLHPGQLVADLEDRAPELAAGLGVWGLRFSTRGPDRVRVDLVDADPLAQVVPFLPPAPTDHLVHGVDEAGATVSLPFDDLTHVIAQGATRSGKSAWAYCLLAQLAARPHVEVAGLDPTGLLLRPFGPHPQGWRASGTADPVDRYTAALAAVVAEMDARIATLPARRDTVSLGRGCPLVVVVLEEWAAVGRLVGHKRSSPSPVHKLVARLLAEGHKAGFRVVTLVQRAESDVVGVFEREQATTNLTFGAASSDTVKMLHGDAALDVPTLAGSAPGVALLSAPGMPLARMRAPWIGGDSPDGYGAYCDAITAA